MANIQRFQNQSAPVVSNEKIARWFHRLFTFLLAAAFGLELASIFLPAGLSGWPETALILLATFSTITSLARQLPLQNVLLVSFVIALVGGAAHALGAVTSIPFGPFTFTSQFGPELFNRLPWATPLIWIVTILNSRGVARLILRPWRKTKTYGFWLIGLTSALTMLFALTLDPFASRIKHYWFWTPTKFPLTWQGASLVDFFGWAIVTLLILAFITPALINKKLSKHSSPDFHPLFVWLGCILIFGAAATTGGLWPVVAVDAAIGIVTIVFAIRGARW
jgi:uncharacterized membrane protein